MEFNTTTFIFEIINFLILVWILQRLFYKPVLAIVAKRRAVIEQSLAEAEKMRREADELRDLYQNRQRDWEREKEAARIEWQRQLDAQRRLQLEQLQEQLEQEKARAQALFARQQQDERKQIEKAALQQGARFAGLLLRQAAGPELESRLVELALAQLENLLKSLNIKENEVLPPIQIITAYPLPLSQAQALQQKIRSLLGAGTAFQFRQESALLAGIRIDIGAWILHADVEHELMGFAEIEYDAST